MVGGFFHGWNLSKGGWMSVFSVRIKLSLVQTDDLIRAHWCTYWPAGDPLGMPPIPKERCLEFVGI